MLAILRIFLFSNAFSSREQQQPLAFSLAPNTATHGQYNAHVGPREKNLVKFGTSRLFADTTKEQESISIDAVSDKLRQLQATIDQRLADAKGTADTESLRREYLGKKGPINEIMGYMRFLSSEDKPKLGAVVNQVKSSVESAIQERLASLKVEEIERQMEEERVDVTQPGVMQIQDIGRRHPLSMTMEKAVDIFTRLGYDTVTDVDNSPEIESDFYCFEALNCPKDHPARDMQDTFYLTPDREMLLRTHTSSVQIRHLEKNKPPLRIVAPGRVYRRDDIDATHSLIFHQVEILALEKRGELTIGHLKGTVEHFLKNMFGPDIKLRFRGSYFPFTEPSMEVDVFFRGKWLEVLGCGMVDPSVLEMAGVDSNEYSGFAAGFGVERFAMVIHGITDIREFYKNDKRFLQQFPHFYDDGLESFLQGDNEVVEEIEYRGEQVPVPIVDNIEQLKEQQAASSSTNGKEQIGEEPEAKKAKKESKESAPPPPTTASEIDVSKLDIRVGLITKAWEHEDADKLFCEEIDIGEAQPRSIASGLRAHYDLSDLEGQRVLVLANLKSRNMLGFPSHGMVLCASASDGDGVAGTVRFIEPPPDAAIGERVMVDGFDGEPATENQVIKKKMLEVIFPDLKTNADGVPCYKGVPLSTSAGNCKSNLPNSVIV